MRKSLLILLLTGWMAGGAPLLAQRARRGSVYENLEQRRLAQLLMDLKMKELLEALVRTAGAGVEGKELLAKAKVAEALRTKDQARRDALLDEGAKIYVELIAATKEDKTETGTLRHFHFRLDAIVLAGITKVEPYVERLDYFLEHAGDAAAVERLTKAPVRDLDRLQNLLINLHDKWNADPEKMITGALWRLETLIENVRYRGAWARYYRGMVLPRDSIGRSALLRQVIDEDVRDFAQAEDNSKGVKYESLRLSGSAARELGQFDNARDFLRRADCPEAQPGLRLKAKFESVRTYLDAGRLAEAGKQIEKFRTDAAQLKGIEPVAVDLHETLATARLLKLQADEIRAGDPARAAKLENQAFDRLTSLTNKHPRYREPLMGLLRKFIGGRDPDTLRPAERMLLAEEEMGKKTPEAFAKAAKALLSIVAEKAASDKLKGQALWNLGVVSNLQKKNLEAAGYWRRLAKEYPKDPNARNAATNAVMTYQTILKDPQRSAALLDSTQFVREYADALKVLVDGFGRKDAKYLYEIGMMMDILDRYQEAIKYFSQVPRESDLYLPARYRILQQRVKDLQDRQEPAPARRQKAKNLAFDLEAYMKRARAFAADPANKARAQEVLGWGAQCGLLVATLQKEVVGNLPEAIRLIEKILNGYKDFPLVCRQARQLMVQIRLEQGHVEAVIGELTKLLEEDPPGAMKLLLIAVPEIGERVERWAFATDAESRQLLTAFRPAYRRFANELYRFAVRQKLDEKSMLPFKRAWAHAHEAGSQQEVEEALKIYEELSKRRELAPFVRGLARCNRRLGRHKEAMKHYNRLIFGGLVEQTGPWWRAQLERLQFYMEINQTKPSRKGLKNTLTHIRQLQRRDSQMGGYYRQFNAIAAQARKLLEAMPAEEAGTAKVGP